MEKQIGEIFKCGINILKVVKNVALHPHCESCYFYLLDINCDKPEFECRKIFREDKNSIYFEIIEDGK